MSPGDRMSWAAGLNVPLASEHGQFEILYWVGCAAAYDRRVQKVARSFIRLLQAANVNFAVLGTENAVRVNRPVASATNCFSSSWRSKTWRR